MPSMTKLTIDQIAKVAHEVNRSYAQAINEPPKPSWEDAPEHQRVSSRKGVQFIIDNPDADPRASHDSWLQEKIRTGWRWGPKLDEIRLEHPQFLPYEQIPVEQKAKDFIFSTLVKQLVAIEVVPPSPVQQLEALTAKILSPMGASPEEQAAKKLASEIEFDLGAK